MKTIILTAVIVLLIALYTVWAVYRIFKRRRNKKGCGGDCNGCGGGCYHNPYNHE